MLYFTQPMKPHYLALLVTTLFLVSVSGVYAAANMGLIPCEGMMCKACDFVSLGNNILNWFVAIMAGIISLMFALGGFTLLMSGGNSGKVSEGKEMMTNAIIGLLIVLSAWLIINTIFKTIASGSISGNWYEIKCVANPSLTADPAKSNVVASGGAGGGAGASGAAGSGVQCATGSTCSPEALKSAGFTEKQAQVMSCIAMTESSGIASQPPYNSIPKNSGSNSTACGLYQVQKSTWKTVASGSCSDFSNCTDASCNIQVAQSLVAKNGYRDWTCPSCNAKAQGCIDKYGG